MSEEKPWEDIIPNDVTPEELPAVLERCRTADKKLVRQVIATSNARYLASFFDALSQSRIKRDEEDAMANDAFIRRNYSSKRSVYRIFGGIALATAILGGCSYLSCRMKCNPDIPVQISLYEPAEHYQRPAHLN